MNHFHTPSLGDESFDLSGIDETISNPIDFAVPATSQTLVPFESKRMQSMEQNLPVSAINTIPEMNSYTSSTAGNAISSNSGIFNITAHLNNNNNNNSNSNSTTATTTTPPPTTTTTVAARKQMVPSPTDPNEPTKPLSAYTLFFRETISALKNQNQNCPFQELNSIVSSLWEALDEAKKEIYNKKHEEERNEYFKQMRIYRQQQQQQKQQQQIQQHSQNLQIESNSIEIAPVHNSLSNNEFNTNNHTQTQSQSEHQQQQQQQHQREQVQTSLASVANTLSASDVQISLTTNINRNLMEEQTTTTTTAAQPISHVQETQVTPQPQTLIETNNAPVLCIRDGCNKRAVMNPDWEDEYCSNECVVIHCRNVFNNWVLQNKDAATVQTDATNEQS